MKSSRVFAFPSTREGFGIVVLEANGCGLPVITTDYHQNAARYLIKEGLNGQTVALSKDNLASAIDVYMAMKPDPRRYTSFLQQYDWNTLTQRVEDVYAAGSLSKAMPKEESTPLGEAYVEALEMSAHEEMLVSTSRSARQE
jgi:glycosyltransferase involved in cell wall biosynthesis